MAEESSKQTKDSGNGGEALALHQLVSADQEILLDTIDQLRGYGISKDLDLPQIIVCGDQSSGKSSLLEAISRLPFPKGDSVCTTFATELALRRNNTSEPSITIKPAGSRDNDEKELLSSFAPSVTGLGGFESMVKNAKEFLREHGKSLPDSYFEDLLHVEVSNPKWPPLTLVDLPGIIHAPNSRQVEEDVDKVNNLVQSYMTNKSCIILAIVTAKNDLEGQKVLRMVKKVDPKGERTIGIITKPDTLSPGSDGELKFVKCAKNEEHELQLGWHVVTNQGFENRHQSLDKRDEVEREFFSKGIWKTALRPDQLGIPALRDRLSTLLTSKIRSALPGIISKINSNLAECQTDLLQLGIPRATPGEQRAYLSSISQHFQRLIEQALDGNYHQDRSFFRADLPDDDPRRMRAVLQNLNEEFAATMHRCGHQREFLKKSAPTVWAIVCEFLKVTASHVATKKSAEAICRKLFKKRIIQLLKPYKQGHLISYDQDLVRTMKNLRDRSKNEYLLKKLNEYKANPETPEPSVQKLYDRVRDMLQEKHMDGDDYASSELLDYMEAYYWVALRTFIDNVATLAVEYCLIDGLKDIFGPTQVVQMSDEDVELLASESESIQQHRQALKKREQYLQGALCTFKQNLDRVPRG
ncbi:hypothetical protein K432DRAFT_473141 [Lepidopterella palustris CBS 459.81]|uniref:Uncharacterized protein n=1 Tax=Lepidopterella palustris CBS 459.81 TaxID=1314670 RepID=A0A8E2DXL8_9PEZI|nr:hypothetical protein K432DRAFT_473141 [Lepidopterella palustris CBS 459.81]